MRITILHSLILISCLTQSFVSCTNIQKPDVVNKEYVDLSLETPKDTLFRFPLDTYEMGQKFCYINQAGDTIVAFDAFDNSFTDTIVDFGIVMQKNDSGFDLVGINTKGQRLYEVYWYDNGPDYISDGLFRILRNGKIGYADVAGNIVIPPSYACANPFENGVAKVTYECQLEKAGDNTIAESDSWFRINKKGEKIE